MIVELLNKLNWWMTSLWTPVTEGSAGSRQSVKDVLQGAVDLLEDFVGPQSAVDVHPLVASAVDQSTFRRRRTLSTTETQSAQTTVMFQFIFHLNDWNWPPREGKFSQSVNETSKEINLHHLDADSGLILLLGIVRIRHAPRERPKPRHGNGDDRLDDVDQVLFGGHLPNVLTEMANVVVFLCGRFLTDCIQRLDRMRCVHLVEVVDHLSVDLVDFQVQCRRPFLLLAAQPVDFKSNQSISSFNYERNKSIQPTTSSLTLKRIDDEITCKQSRSSPRCKGTGIPLPESVHSGRESSFRSSCIPASPLPLLCGISSTAGKSFPINPFRH